MRVDELELLLQDLDDKGAIAEELASHEALLAAQPSGAALLLRQAYAPICVHCITCVGIRHTVWDDNNNYTGLAACLSHYTSHSGELAGRVHHCLQTHRERRQGVWGGV